MRIVKIDGLNTREIHSKINILYETTKLKLKNWSNYFDVVSDKSKSFSDLLFLSFFVVELSIKFKHYEQYLKFSSLMSKYNNDFYLKGHDFKIELDQLSKKYQNYNRIVELIELLENDLPDSHMTGTNLIYNYPNYKYNFNLDVIVKIDIVTSKQLEILKELVFNARSYN